ncbi:hypothetical protein E2C01_011614 [Portunus trituberculatus]|uniref:Uncharacterized protein n=1 Tax=Portunus trituberculatus TaxID=210409 RepID=A0A5B7DBU1_PORTR|nr:hypothetical protein [Portunus trituberculatus]
MEQTRGQVLLTPPVTNSAKKTLSISQNGIADRQPHSASLCRNTTRAEGRRRPFRDLHCTTRFTASIVKPAGPISQTLTRRGDTKLPGRDPPVTPPRSPLLFSLNTSFFTLLVSSH